MMNRQSTRECRNQVKSVVGLRKRENVSKMVKTVKENSMKGVSSLSRKSKELEKPHRDPRYNEKELKASFKVIKKVMEMDEAASFSAPVDPVSQGIPDYFDVIDTPMDFGTLCTNLQNGVKYLNAEGVYKDVQYIWENCLRYNKKGDYIMYLMKRVKKKFIKYWRAAVLQSETPRRTSGSFSQMPHDYFGVMHPQSQVPLSSYNHSYQPQPSTTRIPQFSQSQAQTALGYSHFLPSNHHARKHSKRDATSTMNNTVDSQMQQYNYVAMLAQTQVLFSSYSWPYQLHQPQPSSVRPPQVSQLWASPNVDYLAHSHLPSPTARTVKCKKHATRDAAASMMSGPTHSEQRPQLSLCYLCQSQQSTCLPLASQSHAGADIEEARRLHKLSSMDGAMGHNGSLPWSPLNCMAVNPTELQPEQLPLSGSELDESHPHQASTGQPQPSQPLADVDISSPEHPFLLLVNTSNRGAKAWSEELCCLGSEIPLVSSHSLPQQPSDSHSKPDPSEQPIQKTEKSSM